MIWDHTDLGIKRGKSSSIYGHVTDVLISVSRFFLFRVKITVMNVLNGLISDS